MADNWGLSDAGYYCPTLDEIIAEKEQLAKNLFGDDIATSERTALGKLIRIQAAADQKLYEEEENIYYSLSPATATGVSLDRVCVVVGIKRKPAVCAIHVIRVYGTENYVIQAGTLFRSTSGVKFYALSAASISEVIEENDIDRYYTDVRVQCVDAGDKGNVTTINAPVLVNSDIDEVVYLEREKAGEDTETDIALRKRYNAAADGSGQNTAASIIANVLNLEDVYDCKIKNNTTSDDIEIAGNGQTLIVKAGTYAVIVYANGTSSTLTADIAEAIYQKMPLGVPQSGLDGATITDSAGESHDIAFTYVSEITVDVLVKVNILSDFPRDGSEQIKSGIANYINSLECGQDLILSQLYRYIYSVAGVTAATSLTVNDATSDIPASLLDIIKCNSVSVEMTS